MGETPDAVRELAPHSSTMPARVRTRSSARCDSAPGRQRRHFRPWHGRVVVVVAVVGVVVLVVDDVVGGGVVVLVVTVVVVVVTGPGTLAGSAGSEPASSSVRSKKPSSSRSIPMRVPLPDGTAVYVSSWPTVAA